MSDETASANAGDRCRQAPGNMVGAEEEVKMAVQASCDYCNNLVYDEETEEYVCDVNMDEDDYARFICSGHKVCPYFQSNDEYKIVRHQM